MSLAWVGAQFHMAFPRMLPATYCEAYAVASRLHHNDVMTAILLHSNQDIQLGFVDVLCVLSHARSSGPPQLTYNRAMMMAAERDHFMLVAALAQQGADVNHLTDWGRSPLSAAIVGMAPNSIRMLLDARADIRQKCIGKRTGLVIEPL